MGRSSHARISDLFHVLKAESKVTEQMELAPATAMKTGEASGTRRLEIWKTPRKVTEIEAHVFGGLGSSHTSAGEDPRRVQSHQERSPIFLA